jgi:FixJ family two-component response regulator
MSTTRNIYVAIVDDDESLCRSMGRLLRAAHFQPITYSSAEAFLEDQKHPQFDCLLLDIQLGGISGIELNRQLAGAGSTTPVIFITAHDDPESRKQALAVGYAGYFRKTDSGSEVLDCIRRAVAQSQAGPAATRPAQTEEERTEP